MDQEQHRHKPEVPIRHMDFDFDPSKAAKYCWDNNSWSSAFILTFSAIIPAGERFVIDAVREFRDQIDDPELKARATGLIGQEATHSRLHAEFNDMYDIKGMPVNELVELSNKIYLEFILPNIPKKTALAAACAVEHVTAVMAEDVFSKNPERLQFLDEQTRDFITWHLLEELEHKSVAYDIYEQVDGRYLNRVLTFLAIWGVSVPLGLYGVRKFLNTPGFNQGKKANREGMSTHLKHFLGSSSNFLAYFKKDFHPDDIETTELLENWRDNLFGKKGQLKKFITKTIRPKIKTSTPTKLMAT